MAYILTTTGEKHAERTQTTRDPESAVLGYMLNIRDSVEMDEILDETHMDDATAKKVMDRLIVKGYIKEV